MNVIVYKYSNIVQILQKVQVMKYKYFTSLVNTLHLHLVEGLPMETTVKMYSNEVRIHIGWFLLRPLI